MSVRGEALESRSAPRHAFVVGMVAVVLAAASVLAGTVRAADTAGHAAAAKPVMTIGMLNGPASLDPSKDSATFDVIRSLTNESIIHLAPDGSYVPGLATSWRYFSTGNGPNKGFEFVLRHNARFSDGSPVTAAAVKTWFDYFSHGSGAFITAMGQISQIKTVGKWKVQLILQAPNPDMPYVLAEFNNWGAVSSPASVANPSELQSGTYGAGQYMLDPGQTIAGDHYTLVPNPYYYDKSKVKWSKVVVKVITSSSSMLAALQTGQIDVAQGDATTVSAAQSGGFRVISGYDATSGLLIADRKGAYSKPLGDVRVRQALNYAVDRKAITKAIVGSRGVPTSEWTSSNGFDPKYQNYYAYNPAKAKSLLAAAGYPNGFTLNVLTTTAALGFANGGVLDQAIAKYLEAVGVKLEITDPPTVSQFVQLRRSKTFPVIQISYYDNPMSNSFLTMFSSVGPPALNPWAVNDPGLTKLWVKGIRAKNSSVYWTKMSQYLVTQAYMVPIYIFNNYWYSAKKVDGIKFEGALHTPLAVDWYPAK
jgi:peptide/nickel transport system substrate-binding protein